MAYIVVHRITAAMFYIIWRYFQQPFRSLPQGEEPFIILTKTSRRAATVVAGAREILIMTGNFIRTIL
jgi:hypothetical protein